MPNVKPSVVRDMLMKVRKERVKRTVSDHILVHLKPTRRYDYNSYRGQVNRFLKIDGDFRDLVDNKLVLARESPRGIMPVWADDIPDSQLVEDQIPVPNWAETSTEIVSVANRANLLSIGDISKELEVIAKSGKRAYLAATTIFEALGQKAEEEYIERLAAEEKLEKQNDEIKRMINESLREHKLITG